MKIIPFAYLFSCIIFLFSCTEPTTIGSELLEDDQADLRYTDTITFTSTTVKEDSVRVYTPDIPFTKLLFGHFEDPLFGVVKAGFYIQLDVGLSTPSFSNPSLDSIVLTLAYDSAGVYGALQDLQNLEVYRVTEDMDNGSDYYSNQSFEIASSPIGSVEFIPEPGKDVELPILSDTIVGPHLKIVLDPALGQELLDSSIYEGDFVQTFKGLFITSASPDPTDAMLSFDFQNSFSRMNLYYRNDDTIPALHQFLVTGLNTRLTSFEHDFTGSVIEPFFDNAQLSDSLSFLQSMAGPNLKLHFPYLTELGDVAINKAELEFTLANLPMDDMDLYPPINRLLLSEMDSDGQFQIIRDLAIGVAVFGGNLEEDDTQNVYKMNITAQIQDIVDGKEEPFIFVLPLLKAQNASRAVLYGPNHSEFPAKLKITYTDLN